MRVRRRDLLQKFFADRGPHLAAMIAYFALLSFVPLTFLSLALLGLTGRADESSFLVREIKKTLPGTPIDQIVSLVHAVQDNAAALGIVGGVALLTGSLGVAALQDYAPGFVSNAATAYALSIGVSLIGVFLFLESCYYVLTNDPVSLREVIPGAVLATIVLEATFQVLPLYQRYADLNPGLRAFGAPAILLVWLYVMANVIVLGAGLNWGLTRRTRRGTDDDLASLA